MIRTRTLSKASLCRLGLRVNHGLTLRIIRQKTTCLQQGGEATATRRQFIERTFLDERP